MEQVVITNQIADPAILLGYISNLSLTFVIAICGAFTKEVYNAKKNQSKISILRLIASSLLCSIVMTAVAEYIESINFGVFALICYIFGMWAFPVIDLLMNTKYIAIAVKDILKELKNPLLKGTANAIDYIRKEIKEEKKEKKAAEDKNKPEEEKKEEPPKEEDNSPKRKPPKAKKADNIQKIEPEKVEELLSEDEEIPEELQEDDEIVAAELLRQIRILEAKLEKQVAEENNSA